MKILLVINEKAGITHSEFYSGLHKKIGSVDLRRLDYDDQSKLKFYFAHHVQIGRYDRIVFGLDFEILNKQLKFLQSLSQTVFLDFESHHDFMPGSFKDKHLMFYEKMPWTKIIVNSSKAAVKLTEAGLDSVFIAKGFSSSHSALLFLHDQDYKDTYPEREAFLSLLLNNYSYLELCNSFAVADSFDVLGLEGNTALDLFENIKILIFPDVEMKEYSEKIFEAMSVGHLVFSYDQGEDENKALGFKDMENIVLFSSFEEFQYKLEMLIKQPDLAYCISEAGKKIVNSNYNQYYLGVASARAIAQSTRSPESFRVGFSIFGFKI